MSEMVKTPYEIYPCLFNIHLRWGKVLSREIGRGGTDLELWMRNERMGSSICFFLEQYIFHALYGLWLVIQHLHK